jgi:hypothetical protein
LVQNTRSPWSSGRARSPVGAAGTISDQIGSGLTTSSELPSALTATTPIRMAFAGPLPGVPTEQVVEAHCVVAMFAPSRV